MTSNGLMTVGELSRRTGVPIKTLRQYTDWGLIYTVGRSATNYRLFNTDALWCVQLIGQLRGLGLTVAEIRELTRTDSPIGPQLAQLLRRSRARLAARIAELQQTLRRIDDFEATHQAALAGQGGPCWLGDPRCAASA
ncbi:MerR family transcriptional regulator [Actinokineospora sp. NPDC004072]